MKLTVAEYTLFKSFKFKVCARELNKRKHQCRIIRGEEDVVRLHSLIDLLVPPAFKI